MNSAIHGHTRLTRDAAELFTTDFTCSAAEMTVSQTTDSLNDAGSISLHIKVYEGPYRGGEFLFCFQISANYPFKALEVWALQPIWHPQIELKTGRMQVPVDWSPVLTLKSFARAVQMSMIQPTTEGPLNLEACSLLATNPIQFEQHAQLTLCGGWISGVYFTPTHQEIVMPTPSMEVSFSPERETRSRIAPVVSNVATPQGRVKRSFHIMDRNRDPFQSMSDSDMEESEDAPQPPSSFPFSASYTSMVEDTANLSRLSLRCGEESLFDNMSSPKNKRMRPL